MKFWVKFALAYAVLELGFFWFIGNDGPGPGPTTIALSRLSKVLSGPSEGDWLVLRVMAVPIPFMVAMAWVVAGV